MYNVMVYGKGFVLGTVMANLASSFQYASRSKWESFEPAWYQFSHRYRVTFYNMKAHEVAAIRNKFDWLHGAKVYVYNLDTKQHL